MDSVIPACNNSTLSSISKDLVFVNGRTNGGLKKRVTRALSVALMDWISHGDFL
jgi:hypothetical protein